MKLNSKNVALTNESLFAKALHRELVVVVALALPVLRKSPPPRRREASQATVANRSTSSTGKTLIRTDFPICS